MHKRENCNCHVLNVLSTLPYYFVKNNLQHKSNPLKLCIHIQNSEQLYLTKHLGPASSTNIRTIVSQQNLNIIMNKKSDSSKWCTYKPDYFDMNDSMIFWLSAFHVYCTVDKLVLDKFEMLIYGKYTEYTCKINDDNHKYLYIYTVPWW